jgi:hypothetical protein
MWREYSRVDAAEDFHSENMPIPRKSYKCFTIRWLLDKQVVHLLRWLKVGLALKTGCQDLRGIVTCRQF